MRTRMMQLVVGCLVLVTQSGCTLMEVLANPGPYQSWIREQVSVVTSGLASWVVVGSEIANDVAALLPAAG